MTIRYRVELSEAERGELQAMLGGGKHAARKLKRAQILLAADAGVPDDGTPGAFGGVTLAHNVRDKAEVAAVLARAAAAGGRIVKPAQNAFWGGHHGYFADPDGHLWEVAWNPFFPIAEDGHIVLP